MAQKGHAPRRIARGDVRRPIATRAVPLLNVCHGQLPHESRAPIRGGAVPRGTPAGQTPRLGHSAQHLQTQWYPCGTRGGGGERTRRRWSHADICGREFVSRRCLDIRPQHVAPKPATDHRCVPRLPLRGESWRQKTVACDGGSGSQRQRGGQSAR